VSITNLSPHQLRQAADLKEQIAGLQAQLNSILGDEGAVPGTVETPAASESAKKGRKGTFSAKTRAKMASAQQARWAAKKGVKVANPVAKAYATPAMKIKRHVSEARLNALAKAREARWAKVRAAKRGAEVGTVSEAPGTKPRRTISEAHRKALALAAKARWAKAKRAGKSRL
jgi:hypothetical protein